MLRLEQISLSYRTRKYLIIKSLKSSRAFCDPRSSTYGFEQLLISVFSEQLAEFFTFQTHPEEMKHEFQEYLAPSVLVMDCGPSYTVWQIVHFLGMCSCFLKYYGLVAYTGRDMT